MSKQSLTEANGSGSGSRSSAGACCNPQAARGMFTLKPLRVIYAEESTQALERTLGLWDLSAIGVGGTIGSGIFVMCGLIGGGVAGPAGVFSWLVAGAGCLLSGVAFAELSSLVPSAGSCYAYAYVALGELPAVIVAWCLSLEYGMSAAAIARNWGDKMAAYMVGWGFGGGGGGGSGSDGDAFTFAGMNLFAAGMQLACVAVVLCGANASKLVVNGFCVLKLVLIAFMIITAASLHNSENLVPFAPYGVSGVLKGSISAYFGFLGFDEVCLLSAETHNPNRAVPLSLFITIAVTTAVYAFGAVALSGAMPSGELDPNSGFSMAFRAHGLEWAYIITAIGELVTLPLVVLVSFIAQPRLLYAMAEDGILPKLFSEVDSHGTLFKGSLFSGLVCVVVAAWVPFNLVDDMISAGVLLCFNATNAAVIVMRQGGALPTTAADSRVFSALDDKVVTDSAAAIGGTYGAWHKQEAANGRGRGGGAFERAGAARRVAVLNVAAVVSAMACAHTEGVVSWIGALAVAATLAFGAITVSLAQTSGAAACNSDGDVSMFRVPGVPYVPAIGTWLNYFLLAQLNWVGGLALLVYLAAGTGHYMLWGSGHSVGSTTGWRYLLERDQAMHDGMMIAAASDLKLSMDSPVPSDTSRSSSEPATPPTPTPQAQLLPGRVAAGAAALQ